MTDTKPKATTSLEQQQVLFNENDTVEPTNTPFSEEGVENGFTAQVVFENDDYLPLTANENAIGEQRRISREEAFLSKKSDEIKVTKHSWLWRIIAALFVILLAIEAFGFFVVGFTQSPVITSLYALLLAALTLIASNSLWRELIGLKHFKRRQKMKSQAAELLAITSAGEQENTNKQAKAFCDRVSASLPCDLVFEVDNENTRGLTEGNQQVWQNAVSGEHSAAELVQLYSRVVLSKVDEKALNEIAKFSTEAVVLVALSPIALLDMVIMLSRNLRMINKIAGLYGLKLGYWSRIKLIKQVFVNIAYAGASELVADFGSDMLGAELLGKLSARFAQGLGAGMLTARLGAKTMELCRPIPFEEKPKLTHVRKKIAQQIKSLMSS